MRSRPTLGKNKWNNIKTHRDTDEILQNHAYLNFCENTAMDRTDLKKKG